ncbi:lysophospholipid acyltransferase family protein [Pseudahrensia aquimaris]|uniref:Lysophospholipid acyltransferase family protein n=1 Tax=Pseudahrensia aquimaris TaxID=744461 RepID=A0ABW3FIA2_9HYPH
MLSRIRLVLVLLAAVALVVLLLPFQIMGLLGVTPLARHVPVVFHRCLAWLFGVCVRVEGKAETQRPLMLISNHVSWLDIVVLSTIAPVSFVAKAEMKNWPVFGQLAQLQRTIFIKRESRRTVGHQANDIASRLKQDDVIILFPEGTTSDGHGLYPFKTPLFEAARFALVEGEMESAAVQPVALDYQRLHGMPIGRQWRQHVAWPGEIGLIESIVPIIKSGGLDVTVHFMPPILLTAESNRKVVAEQARAAIRSALAGRTLDSHT